MAPRPPQDPAQGPFLSTWPLSSQEFERSQSQCTHGGQSTQKPGAAVALVIVRLGEVQPEPPLLPTPIFGSSWELPLISQGPHLICADIPCRGQTPAVP